MFKTPSLPALKIDLPSIEVETAAPVINSRRSVCIVYSIDSMYSIAAAALAKNLLSKHLSEAGQLTYDISFVEVDHFIPKTSVTDYIWLGLPALKDAFIFSEETRLHFMKARHIQDTDPIDPAHPSVFCDMLNKETKEAHRDEGVMVASRILGEYQPVQDPVSLSGVFVQGPVTWSLSKISSVIPELQLQDCPNLVYRVTQIDRLLAAFYSKGASRDDIAVGYHEISSALRFLKTGEHTPAANTDSLFKAYLRHYQEVRDQVNRQMTIQDVVVRDSIRGRKTVQAYLTRLNQDFWMVPRIFNTVGLYFHNSRRVDYGTHVTTNLPSGYRDVFIRNAATSNR